MARGINKVILIGNLGQDPEVRFTPSGSAVANLSLATSDSWMDRQTGQRQERTEWHRVVMFNKLAEIAQQYLKKGSKLYVEGRLQTRKWQDQNGQDKYSTEIVANNMEMLDSRGGPDGGQYPPQQSGNYGGGQQQPPQGGAQYGGGQQQPQQAGNYGGGQPSPQQGSHYGGGQQPAPQHQPAPAPASNQPQNNYGAPDPGSFKDFDDEIPF